MSNIFVHYINAFRRYVSLFVIDRDRCGRDRRIVEFRTTYAIIAYYH
jgi:hypothetical protein